ncbi:MAG TPA: hypothetical protein VGN43_20690 [Steroidobacteraceae bacterium]|jgi:photosystem II stability/assembly factor-like uncharacterized protein|nr:hypothetical protein [Steroidobacteraceae bacterium]
MRGIVFAGTAVTRPDSVGSLYRLEPGREWRTVEGIPTDAGVQAITPHPGNESVLFAATRKGLFKSEDAGLTWSRLDAPTEGAQYWSVLIHPADHNLMFAGTSPVGICRSDDGGKTWRRARCEHPEHFKMSFGGSRAMRIAAHPTNRNILYAVAEVNGLIVSTDGGETWTGSNDGVAELARDPKRWNRELTDDDTEGMYDAHAVCTSTASPEAAFYACRMGIFSTTDRGKHLRDHEVSRFAPFRYSRDVRIACDDPRTMYTCFSISSRSNAGAMYRSKDLGESWTRIDASMSVRSTIMGLALHLSDPRGVVSVTRHGQVFYTMDGCETWTETQLPPIAGDAFCAAIL